MTATLAVLAGVMVHPWWWWVAAAWLWAVMAATGYALCTIMWRMFSYPTTRPVAIGIIAFLLSIIALLVVAYPSAHAAGRARFVQKADGRVTLMVAQPMVALRFTLPSTQQGQPCADGAPLAWIDSVRAVARKRGPAGPYVSAQWRAYLAQPDTLLAQHAVSWTRIGLPDSFIVAAADTGATGWIQVHGTRGWSSVCRWVSVGAR